MADQKVRISELPESTSTSGLSTIGVNSSNESVRVPLGNIVEGLQQPINQAKTAATQAKTVATQAKMAAQTATATANEAKQTATSAQTAASEAASAAATANNTANAAQTAASKAMESVVSATRPRLFLNATKLFNLSGPTTLSAVITLLGNSTDTSIKGNGMVITFLGEEGWETWQYVFVLRKGVVFPTFDPITRVSSWRKFGGSASVGNCYNVTNDEPLAQGYYTLETAIAKAFEKGYNTIGIQITFSIANASWKTYQYIGADNTEENFKNESNWIDLAGMSAGDEVMLNVDHKCGACTSASFYTLEYAIAAVVALEQSTGIDYRKTGMIITYKVAENKWETKQFRGETSDFGEAALWADFGGGGGSKVETKDDPEDEGKDAFSTGGAAKYIPTQININTETEGVVKLSLANESGEVIGEEKQFAVGTGSGGGSGTIVSITPEQSPLYGQAGGSMTLRAAIQSITKVGNNEQSNLIERVELYDRDTNQLLETYRLNQASSADAESYDFVFDLSKYFAMASSRKFKLVAYDDSDNTGSRNVNVTAVDVTIKSEQTLNYTASTAIAVGGATKTIPMYRFPNNASDKGILCKVEILINGVWKELGSATIPDTFSHSITVNPNNCAGSVLTHGAYPIRIHGVDVASGVVGNYLHTAIMVVEQGNTTPIVVSRWYSETATASLKQYQTISMDFAAYNPAGASISVEVQEVVKVNGTAGAMAVKQTTLAYRQSTYTYMQRVGGVAIDGSTSIILKVKAGTKTSQEAQFDVNGTLLNIEEVTAQLMLDIDMTGRSNSDADKTITSNGYTLSVFGSNYSTNGFVKDSFGTENYGQENDPGIMALRIAEDVKASLNCAPYNQAAIETNGMAVQFRIRTKHISDDEARLISCISNGIGFYVTGKNVVVTTDNGATVAKTVTAALTDDSLTDVAIVIEPWSQAPYGGIGCIKLYFDGELIGTCYYTRGTLSRHATPITFDGTAGDLYLYNIRVWETYYSFEQSFNNYLLKMADTDSMIREFNFNQVMASQAAEGKPATNRPQAASLHAIGIPYFVVCKNPDTDDVADNYPEYLETLNGDKKTSRNYDIYAYFPDRPWQDFAAVAVPTTNQGTTSSMRPIKNIKMKFGKCKSMRLLHDRSEFSGDALAKYDECAANIAKKRVQVVDGGMPTNIITVKVDYSESGGANNGASTQLFNELQIAMGANYRTPAQNAYTGKYTLNTSIDSIPCAFFRTDINSSDATSPSYGYFHAKGNWNFDKGDPKVFGFEGVDGYNAECLNYGDFIELVAARNQSLENFAASINKAKWDETDSNGKPNIYVLSEFCGPRHKVFRYVNGAWTETTGTMTYSGGKWHITGDVVNPVENYELRAYDAMDWFQGVNSMDDMLAAKDPSLNEDGSVKDPTPVWLTYFESRYPDNDDLNQAYEDGRKLPYALYKWLEWCQQCNQNLTAADGNITVDGVSMSGTKANRLTKFKRELHKVANVHSCICYHVFTDYLACVDQRSKNMMVGFYLDPDGVVRMYLNHLYDGDTILGSDNDCGLTIPALLDPNNDPNGYYQGHDSVLFTQLAAADYIWLKDYTGADDTADTTKTTTVRAIAKAMRECTLANGLRPFSPQGIIKYWVTDRLAKWPKLVSSYDGIRKYIEHSASNDNYFYALHGLSIQRLEEYVKTRFLYRDGFYQCGDTFASAMQMRCTGTNMSVTIKAGKDGFVGIGVDQANVARESVYLHAGETTTLHSGNTNLGSGVMLYIFGANIIEELDLRNATPKQSGWDISELTLLKKLILGGSGFSPATSTGEELSTLNLGQLPFLEEIDARNFPLTSIDATYCPRLKKVLATGTNLTKFTPAETSPLETLSLPASMTDLKFVNLPKLTYPNGGLSIAGFANVLRFQLSGCNSIDTAALMENVVSSATNLAEILIDGLNVNAPATLLQTLMQRGVKGINSNVDEGCDGLRGEWVLPTLIEDEVLDALNAYFHNPTLIVRNAQFSIIVFDDTVNDPKNITNMENNTTGDDYEASGHFLRIRKKLIPVKGKLDTASGKWKGVRISENNYRKLYNGADFDYTDDLGEGFDAMMRCPGIYAKGINDFKNQKKYVAFSSLEYTPLSTAKTTRRVKLSDCIHTSNAVVITTDVVSGETPLSADGVISPTPNYNVHEINVDGMKQVRWPGLNNTNIGAVFVDDNDVIIDTFNMTISHSLFDFVEGSDYVFTDVPAGAKKLIFASPATALSQEAIAVDSSHIEAIEPDWVYYPAWLGGIYQASVDGLVRLRSVSGATVKTGDNNHNTSTEWQYDANGKPTNTPLATIHYTNKDRMNLAARRGAGYQLFDYEMSKLMALLWMALNGTRDVQLKCGYGKGAGGAAGYMDTIGNTDSVRGTSNNGNKVLGFESFVGCTWEVMDNVAVNVVSYDSCLKNHFAEIANDPIDAVWHIYDPINKTERTVQGITTTGYCIGRVRNGKYCDVVASKCTTDNSKWVANYCDTNYYTASKCRVVGRSNNYASAYGGLVCAFANNASSDAYTSSGARLAFRGEIVIEDE